MSKYSRRNFLKLAGASVAVGVSGVAVAGENPFEFKSLEGGYEQVAAAQGNCGANKQMNNDQSKGETMQKNSQSQMKNGQGSCGAAVMKQHNGNCGAAMPQQKQKNQKESSEGKCGYQMQ
ncbi:twin-arginine translocation signal domain-containing protein [Hydrogenovibrio kuenenii]|jgi:uncharacterized low-complexity protein|uniref:twin-arginine translocation signal domain-containing protein n=1 Tax=Hydrogenovibrio kuenenii TaxID=63658 RepID=UPI0004636289|nr:twin-arginine translocation signal domain-containing protein [Hydrogenovibrio kuenenii]